MKKRFNSLEEVEALGQYESETLIDYIYNYEDEAWLEQTQKPILLDFINHIYNMGREEAKM